MCSHKLKSRTHRTHLSILHNTKCDFTREITITSTLFSFLYVTYCTVHTRTFFYLLLRTLQAISCEWGIALRILDHLRKDKTLSSPTLAWHLSTGSFCHRVCGETESHYYFWCEQEMLIYRQCVFKILWKVKSFKWTLNTWYNHEIMNYYQSSHNNSSFCPQVSLDLDCLSLLCVHWDYPVKNHFEKYEHFEIKKTQIQWKKWLKQINQLT